MEYRDLRESDLMNAGVLYKAYRDYMYLYNTLQNIRENERTTNGLSLELEKKLRSRRDYILKNKIKQRDEISTICWILGEEDERETKY